MAVPAGAKGGIRLRLLLLGVVPAALMGLALSAYFTWVRLDELDRRLGEQGNTLVKQLAFVASQAYAAGDRASLGRLGQRALQQQPLAMRVVIFDHSHNALIRLARKAEGTAGERVFLAPIFRHDASAPAGPIVGGVAIALSQRETRALRRDALVSSFVITLIGLLAGAWAAHRMGRKITTPVRSLALAINALSQGRLDTRTEITADGALGYLQAGFNAMAAELQNFHRHQEAQIQLATGRLRVAMNSLELRNRELDAARRLAEDRMRAKSLFLAQVSHEIRTPMNGILGCAELLKRSPLDEEQVERLSLVERAARNLLTTIDATLELARLEAGNITLHLRPFSLRSCLEDAIALQTQGETESPIVLWIEPRVPAMAAGDPVRLQQVIVNLLVNALKFTRRGRIVLRVRAAHGKLLFSVADSGIGISTIGLKNICHPFVRADGNEQGTGLGLSIARELVAAMGGVLRVASRLGKGSCFWFELSLADADAEASATTDQAPADVVLVDANKLSRQALRFQLLALGGRVHELDSLKACAPKAEQVILVNTVFLAPDSDLSLGTWLARARSAGAHAILLLPPDEHGLSRFYRNQGASCIDYPPRSAQLVINLRRKAWQGKEGDERSSKARDGHTHASGEAKRVLIVDDNEINRLVLRGQLENLGAEVTEAANGQEGLWHLQHRSFDLALLDLQMPDMSGLEVMHRLHEGHGASGGTPIVALSAHAEPDLRQRLIAAGCVDVLIKPLSVERLHELLLDGALTREAPEQRTERSHYRVHAAPSNQRKLPAVAQALLMRCDADRHQAFALAGKLYRELPTRLDELRSALAAKDRAKARQVAHTINGTAAFCALDPLRDAASALESSLSDPDAEPIDQALAPLAREIEILLAQQEEVIEALLGDDISSHADSPT
jgi:two-component system sensor histidine kinase BarA